MNDNNKAKKKRKKNCPKLKQTNKTTSCKNKCGMNKFEP